ncbi:MAG: amidohydrolase family protein [Pseudomonadales bacterium]|nr:amidohydrolase family protein [Pseudomonadales bacterium]
MTDFDTIITGGTIVDGTRNRQRFAGDIAIKGGLIAAVAPAGGLAKHTAEKVIDARGLVVAPGFVDLHTHYDGQLLWDPYLSCSSWHGVTSVAIGNCGFGFAPTHPEQRERAMLSMERVEAIPLATMKAGMDWDWETFPQWLDSIDRRPKGINVMSFVPLNPLMIYVMGVEAAKSRDPDERELKEMLRLMEESLDAGGVGFSMQRLGDGFTSVQRDYDGTPMPTDTMSDELCLAFARILKKRGKGFIQLTQAKNEFTADLDFGLKLAEASDAAVLWNAVQVNERHPHQHRRMLKWVNEAREKGLNIWMQAITTPNDMRFKLDNFNLFDGNGAWRDVTIGDVATRISKMQDPALRKAVRDDYDFGSAPFVSGPVAEIVVDSVVNPENQKYVGLTIAQLGPAMGRHPADAMLDLAISEQLQTVFYVVPFNYREDLLNEVLENEWTVPGVSDGGAHTKFLNFGRYPTNMLQDLVRERGSYTLEEAHYRLSALPAMAAGFSDRGTLEVGRAADIVIYDFENLRMLPTEIVHDLPGNEWRYVEKAEGYRYIMVNGELTFVDGVCTGAIPGKLLRHGKAAVMSSAA